MSRPKGPEFRRVIVMPHEKPHDLPADLPATCARCGRPPGRYVHGFPPSDDEQCFRWFPEIYPGDTPLGTGRTAQDFAEFVVQDCDRHAMTVAP